MTKCVEIEKKLNAINPWLQTSVEDLLVMFGKPGALLKYRRMQEILTDPDWVDWLGKPWDRLTATEVSFSIKIEHYDWGYMERGFGVIRVIPMGGV